MSSTETWDLRHWKNRQLDLFLWNEVPEFEVTMPIVVNRNVNPDFHMIVGSNPMITDEIIDLYAKRIADEIDKSIFESMTRSLGEYSKTAYGVDC